MLILSVVTKECVLLVHYNKPYLELLFILYAGIKINNLYVLDSRGYSRTLIASRAIESYLIQVDILLTYAACIHSNSILVFVI